MCCSNSDDRFFPVGSNYAVMTIKVDKIESLLLGFASFLPYVDVVS